MSSRCKLKLPPWEDFKGEIHDKKGSKTWE